MAFLLLFVGCSNQEANLSNQFFSELQVDYDQVKTELSEKEVIIQELQSELNRLAMLSDLVLKQQDSLGFLYSAINERSDQFPIAISDGNNIKDTILRSINYKDPKIEVYENEVILFSGILEEVNSSTDEVLVELGVYQHFVKPEDISPPKQMFIVAKRDSKDQWLIERFSRSN